MEDDHATQRNSDLALVVVREKPPPLPDELSLDTAAKFFRDSRNEKQIARVVHGRIDRIAGSTTVSGLQSFRRLAYTNRAASRVGLDIDARCLAKTRPRFGELRELLPIQVDYLSHRCLGDGAPSARGYRRFLRASI